MSINILGQGESPLKSCWLEFLQHSQHLKAKLEALLFLLRHPTWLSMELSKHCPGLIPPSR